MVRGQVSQTTVHRRNSTENGIVGLKDKTNLVLQVACQYLYNLLSRCNTVFFTTLPQQLVYITRKLNLCAYRIAHRAPLTLWNPSAFLDTIVPHLAGFSHANLVY